MSPLVLSTSVPSPVTAAFVLSLSYKRTAASTPRALSLSSAAFSCAPSLGPLSTSSRASLGTSFRRILRIRHQPVSSTRSRSLSLGVRSEASAMEVIVKSAVGEPDKLGDCPFSQRVLLTLEEKAIPYNARFVDLQHKPQWFLEINPGGKVPVLKVNGEWVPDSDVITEILEKDFPEPSLKVSEANAKVGSALFGAFLRYLKSKDPSDGTKEAIVAELQALDSHLAAKGPYLDGDKITSIDLALIPKLYHLQVALAHFKKFTIPAEFTSILKYVELMESTESWKKTSAAPELVIKGWAAHEGVL